MIFILTFFINLGIANKVFKSDILFTNKVDLDSDILTIKVRDNTQSLISINDRSIRNGKMLAKEIDFNINKRLNTFELILLVGDLIAKILACYISCYWIITWE